MNIVLGLVIFLLCVIMAFVLSTKYVEKRKFYEDFLSFNDKLKVELSFTKLTLKKLMEGFNGRKTIFFNCATRYFDDKEMDLTVKWLRGEEKDYVKSYFSTIGTSDAVSQLEYVRNVDVELRKKYDDAKNEEKKYRQLYLRLGILIGLAGFIIVL